MINVNRERWIVKVDTPTEPYVFCGLAMQYELRPVSDLGGASIKTYISEKKAYSSFASFLKGNAKKNIKINFDPNDVKIIKVMENYTEL